MAIERKRSKDQRKLTVSINKMHIDKIEYMNNELSDYIERYFGQYTFDFSCDYVSYLLSSQNYCEI